MTLDVVIPTYNRRELVAKTVRSLMTAELPPGLTVTVIVVDNNCTDGTAAFVQGLKPAGPIRLRYLKETRQGISNARNAGIAAGDGELIGFIDDDEQVDPAWYKAVAREFRDPAVEFIGGPYEPIWGAAEPSWSLPDYFCVIGIVRPEAYGAYDRKFPGMLMGGNAVIRRDVFRRVGIYSPEMGRTDKGLLSMEDYEFYERLLRNGIRGLHVPDLVIHHYIPPSRLTKKYHRRWFFWHSVSAGMFDKHEPEPVVYFAGIPRHLIGSALRGLLSIPRSLSAGKEAEAFRNELHAWRMAGFFYGKHWFAPRT